MVVGSVRGLRKIFWELYFVAHGFFHLLFGAQKVGKNAAVFEGDLPLCGNRGFLQLLYPTSLPFAAEPLSLPKTAKPEI